MKTSFILLLSGITVAGFSTIQLTQKTKTPIKNYSSMGKQKTNLPVDTSDQSRFVKTDLVHGKFMEPTEIAVLPNLDILVTQRRGEFLIYKNKTKELKDAGKLDVYCKTNTPNVNAEEGLLGIAADPDFATNQYVYAYYSPTKPAVNRLSRFKLVDDKINMESEKVILQFSGQRDICCHTGGSLAFGPDRLLYLSTGDNSTPFDAPNQQYVNKGFAPLDNRPGLQQYDSRRSAGNTNDLRGKVLRMRINLDGTYSIPKGNLFPENEPKTRPEIYVMGNRNPYRISVDQKTGYLYWGEVGPDANNDDPLRGPKGYDEINQARKAGNFGWPLFVGNNYPYRAYDYTNGQSGAPFDPAKPINNSPNNTGLTELPAAQPAYIWYPYIDSKDFPEVGAGGRTAMAGPVYYPKPGGTPYPSYYNGKLIIYDWIRGWVKAVTMSPEGNYISMEPFLASVSLSAPIDMEEGPDGHIYILEYGKGWFTQNPDAGIVRIDYLKGNRPPVVKSLNIRKTSGLLPYKMVAKVAASDPDHQDILTYVWDLGKGVKKTTTKPELQYTFTKAGEYPVSVAVTDNHKASVKSEVVSVFAGNEQPEVNIVLTGNKSFYFPSKAVSYQVLVADKGAAVDKSRIYVSNSYTEGLDLAGAQLGHQEAAQMLVGRSLMLKADCSTCHKISTKSIGPAFTMVSAKYQDKPDAAEYLASKVIKGSVHVWGEVQMPAHASMNPSEVKQITEWIMTLSAKTTTQPSLPTTGKIIPPAAINKKKPVLTLKASYSDLGGTGLKPLTTMNVVNLRSNAVEAKDIKEISGLARKEADGIESLILPDNSGWLVLKGIDLTNIAALNLGIANIAADVSYTIQIKLDGQNGQTIGQSTLTALNVPISAVKDGKFHDVYISFKAGKKDVKDKPLLKTVVMQSL